MTLYYTNEENNPGMGAVHISEAYQPRIPYESKPSTEGVEISPVAEKFTKAFLEQMSGIAQVGNPTLKRKVEPKSETSNKGKRPLQNFFELEF